ASVAAPDRDSDSKAFIPSSSKSCVYTHDNTCVYTHVNSSPGGSRAVGRTGGIRSHGTTPVTDQPGDVLAGLAPRLCPGETRCQAPISSSRTPQANLASSTVDA